MECIDFFPVLPDPSSPNFAFEISRKKEFLDKSSMPTEDLVAEGKAFFNAQEVIRMLITTVLDSIALFWEPGAGKTCAAEAAAAFYRHMDGEPGTIDAPPIRRMFIFESSTALLKEIRKQIICNCSGADDFNKARYASEKLNQTQWNKAIDRELAKFYTFVTYRKEMLALEKMNDDEIRERYNNSIIFLDEFHNVKSETWSQIFRVTHTAVNVKTIIATGTPINNNRGEIARIMNVILPFNQQMPYDPSDLIFKRWHRKQKITLDGVERTIEKHAYQVYLDMMGITKDQIPKFDYRKATLEFLEPFLRNKVSWLRKPDTGMDAYSQGYVVSPDDAPEVKVTVYPVEMSEFQTRVYMRYLRQTQANGPVDMSEASSREGIKPFYSSERQASNVAYPDESIGMEGFNRFVNAPIKEKHGKRTVSIGNYSAKASLRERLRGENLKELSAKIYEAIHICKQNLGRKVFIFDDFVYESGVIFEGICFGENGFELLVPEKDMFRTEGGTKTVSKGVCGTSGSSSLIPLIPKKLRVAVIHSKVPAAKVSAIMDLFNCEPNDDGSFLQVIIGSPSMKEGYSLRENFITIIMSARWNVASFLQITNRSRRVNAHNKTLARLRASDPEARGALHIYQLVAIPNLAALGNVDRETALKLAFKESIDVSIYLSAMTKEKQWNEGMIEMIKRLSVDLLLNYPRNIAAERSDARLYGGEAREYTLYPYNINSISPDQVDTSTYDSLFVEARVKKTSNKLIEMFSRKFQYTFDELLYETRETEKLLARVLSELIFGKVVVKDKFSRSMYIYETGDIYWLAPVSEKSPTIDSVIYTSTLPICTVITRVPTIVESAVNTSMTIAELISEDRERRISIFESAVKEYSLTARPDLERFIRMHYDGYWAYMYQITNVQRSTDISRRGGNRLDIDKMVIQWDTNAEPVIIHFLDLFNNGPQTEYDLIPNYETFNCKLRIFKVSEGIWRDIPHGTVEYMNYNAGLQYISSIQRQHIKQTLRVYATYLPSVATGRLPDLSKAESMRFVDGRESGVNLRETHRGARLENKPKNSLYEILHVLRHYPERDNPPTVLIPYPDPQTGELHKATVPKDQADAFVSQLAQYPTDYLINLVARVAPSQGVLDQSKYRGQNYNEYLIWSMIWGINNPSKKDLNFMIIHHLEVQGRVKLLTMIPQQYSILPTRAAPV